MDGLSGDASTRRLRDAQRPAVQGADVGGGGVAHAQLPDAGGAFTVERRQRRGRDRASTVVVIGGDDVLGAGAGAVVQRHHGAGRRCDIDDQVADVGVRDVHRQIEVGDAHVIGHGDVAVHRGVVGNRLRAVGGRVHRATDFERGAAAGAAGAAAVVGHGDLTGVHAGAKRVGRRTDGHRHGARGVETAQGERLRGAAIHGEPRRIAAHRDRDRRGLGAGDHIAGGGREGTAEGAARGQVGCRRDRDAGLAHFHRVTHRGVHVVGHVAEQDVLGVDARRQRREGRARGHRDRGAAARRQRARDGAGAAIDQQADAVDQRDAVAHAGRAAVAERVRDRQVGEGATHVAHGRHCAGGRHAQATRGAGVDEQGAGVVGVQPGLQLGCSGAAAEPRHRHATVEVVGDAGAAGAAAVQLTHHAVILVEQGAAGAASLGGAQLPVANANVRAITGRRGAVVAGGGAGVVVEADALLVGVGVMDADVDDRLDAAGIPTGVGNLPCRVG